MRLLLLAVLLLALCNLAPSLRLESINRRLAVQSASTFPVRFTVLASQESDYESNDDAEPKASLQWLITQRMRQVLVDELQYLDAEVDLMDPQIAAVVIRRKLHRPKNGMPLTWRKHVSEDTTLRRWGKAFSERASATWIWIFSRRAMIIRQSALLLSSALLVSAVSANRQHIVVALTKTLSRLRRSSPDLSLPKPQVTGKLFSPLTWIVPKKSAGQSFASRTNTRPTSPPPSSSDTRVDLQAWNRAQRSNGIFHSLAIRWKSSSQS